jgi:hypothetical protein
MVNAWITNGTTTLEAMVNPINAACDEGFVPDRLYMIENPKVTDTVAQALDLAVEIINAYGGDDPDIQLTSVDSELYFDQLYAHAKEAIADVRETDGEVAVDFTPGRKFMSAIAFSVGMHHEADHVYYFYLENTTRYGGRIYPSIPRTASQLYDFTEVLQ